MEGEEERHQCLCEGNEGRVDPEAGGEDVVAGEGMLLGRMPTTTTTMHHNNNHSHHNSNTSKNWGKEGRTTTTTTTTT